MQRKEPEAKQRAKEMIKKCMKAITKAVLECGGTIEGEYPDMIEFFIDEEKYRIFIEHGVPKKYLETEVGAAELIL